MPSKQVNQLAARGLEIKAAITQLDNELKGINVQLIASGEGQTIELDGGRVIVTNSTEARPTGTFDLVFDRLKFLELDPADDLRVLAERRGIVRFEPGQIAGRPSFVQYSLAKKS